MCFRYPNCKNDFCANVQQSENQFENSENGGFRRPLATDKLMYKKCKLGNKNSNNKVKSTQPTEVQILVPQKAETTEG